MDRIVYFCRDANDLCEPRRCGRLSHRDCQHVERLGREQKARGGA